MARNATEAVFWPETGAIGEGAEHRLVRKPCPEWEETEEQLQTVEREITGRYLRKQERVKLR